VPQTGAGELHRWLIGVLPIILNGGLIDVKATRSRTICSIQLHSGDYLGGHSYPLPFNGNDSSSVHTIHFQRDCLAGAPDRQYFVGYAARADFKAQSAPAELVNKARLGFRVNLGALIVTFLMAVLAIVFAFLAKTGG
jgi:hypothetical protein